MVVDGPLSSVTFRRVSGYAECATLGKGCQYRESSFAEGGTRQRSLCQVPDKRRSAKLWAFGKEPNSGSVDDYTKIDVSFNGSETYLLVIR
jgi:hypothetical protein